MKKAAVLMNPKAGGGKAARHLEEIGGMLIRHFHEVTFCTTVKPGDAAKHAVAKADDVDLIIAAGGDGTVHEIVNALSPLPQRPILAIIPTGTNNDFSRALGIKQHPVRACEQLLEKRTTNVDVGVTNQSYFLNFWGIGLITTVSTGIDPRAKETIGRMSYFMSAAQNFADAKPFHITVTSPAQNYNGEAVMLLAGNGPYLGGFRPFFPAGDVGDGKLDVLIVKETSLQSFWSMIRSKVGIPPENDDDGLIYFQTDRLRVIANPSQAIDCDGEQKGETPADIHVLKQHLTMIVGDFPQ